MERVLASLAGRMAGLPGAPPLLVGTGRDETHLLVVATSDRGLAGGFNSSILRETRRRIRELTPAGKTVMVLTIGRKGRDGLRRDYGRLIHDSVTEIVTAHQLIPFQTAAAGEEVALAGAIYEFEPSEEEILAELLPKNLAVQIYTALLENAASEQGARMTAMDNATRNAGEMIDRLT